MIDAPEKYIKKFFRGFLGGAGQPHIDAFESKYSLGNAKEFVMRFWDEQKRLRQLADQARLRKLEDAGYSNPKAVSMLVDNEAYERKVNDACLEAVREPGLAEHATYEHDGDYVFQPKDAPEPWRQDVLQTVPKHSKGGSPNDLHRNADLMNLMTMNVVP